MQRWSFRGILRHAIGEPGIRSLCPDAGIELNLPREGFTGVGILKNHSVKGDPEHPDAEGLLLMNHAEDLALTNLPGTHQEGVVGSDP